MDSTQKEAAYGSWASPITSDLIVAQSISLLDVWVEGPDVYWLEGRPQEKGRYVIVRRTPDGTLSDVNPMPFYARTRVHEYGGGGWLIAGGTAFFSNFEDQRLYRVPVSGGTPEPLTPSYSVDIVIESKPEKLTNVVRYADVRLDESRRRLICVMEDHRPAVKSDGSEDAAKVINTLAAIDLDSPGSPPVELMAGHDFYSNPRLSPDGRRIAWLTWDHPRMPWVGTTLWVASIDAKGKLTDVAEVAGGDSESIFQPEWSPDGRLYFISDRSGWWNLYRVDAAGKIRSLCPQEAEFGVPQWNFGLSTYAFLSDQELICAYSNDIGCLARLDVQSGTLTPIDLPFQDYSALRAAAGQVAFRAGSPTTPAAIILFDPQTSAIQSLQTAGSFDPSIEAYFTKCEPIEFPTAGGREAHAFFYPPFNPDYRSPGNELPPLVVKCHGGPTSAASSTLSLQTQFWTSRGVAVVDVNYGGSTGFGRGYRDRLKLNWGIVDVEDCAAAVRYLVGKELIDPRRAIITGGSAGGYTTLTCLTAEDPEIRKVFCSGASHYGVSDAEALARDTHKFESRYLDWLIAPYFDPDPEIQSRNRRVYRDRSPIHHADRLAVPVTFFQGDEDEIVPPNQTELMVERLREKGVPVGYLLFAGEQHGFRQSGNIKRALDAELYFYAALAFRVGLSFALEAKPAPAHLQLQPPPSSSSNRVKVIFFDLGDTLVTQGPPQFLTGAKELLDKLKIGGIRLGVLSNTGTLSREQLKSLLPPDFDWGTFVPELVLLSSEIGLRKPDPAIFAEAVKRAGIPAAQCLYCSEDLLETLVAEGAGMRVARLQKPPQSDVAELCDALKSTGTIE